MEDTIDALILERDYLQKETEVLKREIIRLKSGINTVFRSAISMSNGAGHQKFNIQSTCRDLLGEGPDYNKRG